MKWLSNNKKRVLYFSIVGVVLLIGVSYAVWVLTYNQANPNVAMSACFDLSFTEANDISLVNAYPMTDEEGKALTPYTFTIKNKCSDYASYQVNLEVLNNSTLDSSYVKSEFNDRVKLVSAYPVTTKTLNNASTAYKLIQGYLNPNESITYNLKLWIDYNSTADQSANKTYETKITIASTYKGTNPSELEECIKNYGENSLTCMIMAQADPENSKCLKVNQDGSIEGNNTLMNDDETPIICSMEDDYGTSYYLRGNHQDNNVKFAGMCWKMLRVTGDGGIKLIYNGDLDENGNCTITSGTHAGFIGQTFSLSGNKVYGTSYTYDGSTYILTDTSTMNWASDSDSIIGKYTCGNTNTSCEKLYYILSKESDELVLALTNYDVNYSSIGRSAYAFVVNAGGTSKRESLAHVGYMYDNIYPYQKKYVYSYKTILNVRETSNSNYYYSDSIEYRNGWYYLKNEDGSPVTQLSWDDNYMSLPGKYTCMSSNFNAGVCNPNDTAYRVIDTTTKENYMIAEQLSGGRMYSSPMLLSQSYSVDETGTYELLNFETLTAMDWYNNYSNYKNYYVCEDMTRSKCTKLYKILSPSQNHYRDMIAVHDDFYYGESFTFDNNGDRPYILNNADHFWDASISTNATFLDTHHYTCFNTTDNTCNELYYLYYSYDQSLYYYIKLSGNETGPEALNKMIGNSDININSSSIKKILDYWYEQKIEKTPMKNYLEDVIFCNDRSISKLNGWGETGQLGSSLFFNGDGGKRYLKCPNKRDAFTVSDASKGNASLTYSVGLLTTTEAILVGNDSALKTGSYYWTMTPKHVVYDYSRVNTIRPSGTFFSGNDYDVNTSSDVRPVIALKPTTQFKTGTDGTASNPYEIE